MEYIPSQKKSKSIGQMAFEFIDKIFELSTHEFRGGYWTKKDHGNWIEEVYISDSRKVYCQALRTFMDFLRPHFNDNIKEKVESLETKQEDNLKSFNEGKIKYEKYITKKLSLFQDIFKQLMFLLKEKDYLKGELYEDIMETLEEEEKEYD